MLTAFADAGVLDVADVQIASRLAALAGEGDERVHLAVALLVRGTRQGSVVLDLADAAETIGIDVPAELPWPEPAGWVQACTVSSLADETRPGGAPVRVAGSRLWLDRYWRQEAQVAESLLARATDPPTELAQAVLFADLAALFDDPDQREAARVAAGARVSVVAGGPGTGKTTTIARLITVLRRQLPELRIALAAPTGKAAARLEESVHAAAGTLTDDDRAALGALSASTVHRLLGRRPGVASRFRHDRDNRLPYDLVIVDECSMVSLTLMARLLEALAPATRLVLVGDPDQLASVEAGAVLGDLVDAPALPVATLRTVHRFAAGGPIAELAEHIRAGRGEEALTLLTFGSAELSFVAAPDDAVLAGDALATLQRQRVHEQRMIAAARAGDAPAALDELDRHRLLCAHRSGPRGASWWGTAVERWLAADDPLLVPRIDGRYAGQPLLVTENDYENGLYNGDSGVVVEAGEDLLAAFRRGGTPFLLPLVRLAAVRPMHAMTIHRAQGSQFDEVTVLLPLADSPLATRQTLYTAITRAVSRVRVIGSEEAVLACVRRQAARATGLRDRLAQRDPDTHGAL